MNCDRNPWADDDPMLPAQDAPVGRCNECDMVHRLDLGCPFAERGRMRIVAFLVVVFVGAAAVWVWRLMR